MVTAEPRKPAMLPLLILGTVTGVLSGVFGIGGGVLLVPLLVIVCGYSQRIAAGTSVAAILPAAAVASVGYVLQDNVSWAAAGSLAVGTIFGAQLGSFFLSRIPVKQLRICFMIFLAAVAISLWFVVPARESQIQLDLVAVVMLVVTGFVIGILSGLLGVGGGVVAVPALMFFFGANDLEAKGTSLLMVIPSSISGTIANAKRHNVDLRAAIIIGIAASVLAPFGTMLATRLDPFWSNVAFSVLLAYVIVQMLVKELKGNKKT